MRGDGIFVRTLEGSRSRDEGSECSQALPYNSVRGFQIHQTAGRSRVVMAQEPTRMNNYTAMLLIEDNQGGRRHLFVRSDVPGRCRRKRGPGGFF